MFTKDKLFYEKLWKLMLPMMLQPLCRIKAELRFITELYRCTGKKSQKEEAYGIRIRAFLRECPVCLQ